MTRRVFQPGRKLTRVATAVHLRGPARKLTLLPELRRVLLSLTSNPHLRHDIDSLIRLASDTSDAILKSHGFRRGDE